MKPSHLLLVGSLLANAALFAALHFVSADSPEGAHHATATTSAAATTATMSAATKPHAPATATAPSEKRWAALDREEVSTLVARLRADGFPPEVIRAIVNLRFELRREELTRDGMDRPYWKHAEETTRDPATEATIARLQQEQADTLKKLFGAADDQGDEEARGMRRRQFGDIPPEKIARLTPILQRYGKDLSQLFATLQGASPAAAGFAEKVAAVQQQMHDELAHTLTPSELLDYDLRNSNAAGRLRNELAGFNPTEAEYRALFPLYQAAEAQNRPVYGELSPEEAAARFAVDQNLHQQAKALLPPDRLADFEQATRPGAQQLNQLVARLDLPLSAAAQVMTLQQDIQQRAAAVRSNRTLPADERSAQLAALAQEASTQIASVLGPRGLEGYKQNGGQWLNQLQPGNARKK
ncbi:MAG TPA: hypothetical protein VHD62_16375 [Opitutaceae bacterium]|nr:hypothetical protein [Opitutaceae bacterium]